MHPLDFKRNIIRRLRRGNIGAETQAMSGGVGEAHRADPRQHCFERASGDAQRGGEARGATAEGTVERELVGRAKRRTVGSLETEEPVPPVRRRPPDFHEGQRQDFNLAEDERPPIPRERAQGKTGGKGRTSGKGKWSSGKGKK